MAQAWTEEKLLNEDPLHDVKDEIKHGSPHLKHVDLHDKSPEDVQMEDTVKSEVPAAFVGELKDDHCMTQSVHDLKGSESGFMEADPLHNVKQEIESGSPHLKHVETPDSSMVAQQDGDVVKSEVPEAFEEELKNDPDIVKSHEESPSSKEKVSAPSGDGEESLADGTKEFKVVSSVGSNLRSVSGRGTPNFRISAHHGMRPGGPLSRDLKGEPVGMCVKDDDEEESLDDATPEESPTTTNKESIETKSSSSRGVPVRGTPSYRVSAHHGMRPGGPLSRDLKSETAEIGSGEGVGADLSGETKPKGPVLHRGPGRGGLSNSGPRRGGLARTGSGVPGEQKGGGSLARTGSGVSGTSLARTGSGIPPAKGGNDLKDFSSFLDSGDVKQEEKSLPVTEESSHEQKGVFGKLGDKWNQLNSYETTQDTKNSSVKNMEGAKDTVVETFSTSTESGQEKTTVSKEETVTGEEPKEGFFQKIKGGVKDQLVPSK